MQSSINNCRIFKEKIVRNLIELFIYLHWSASLNAVFFFRNSPSLSTGSLQVGEPVTIRKMEMRCNCKPSVSLWHQLQHPISFRKFWMRSIELKQSNYKSACIYTMSIGPYHKTLRIGIDCRKQQWIVPSFTFSSITHQSKCTESSGVRARIVAVQFPYSVGPAWFNTARVIV